jgi:hydroxymethylbilane synthase
MDKPRVITIGTRSSKLALTQTNMIKAALESAHPGLEVRIEHITTKGDIILDRPLSAIGDKGLFVTEIEDAMREGRVDLAVHSAKDLPSDLPEDMVLAAFPPREDPRDALVARNGYTLATLPQGAVVGTSSLRRSCQLRAIRPDLQIKELRGNIDTRVRKLHEGQYDAIVLAAAGLLRIGIGHEISEYLEPDVMLPAVSQGILGLEIRANDPAVAALLAPLNHPEVQAAAEAERAFLARIGGGCQVPIAAYAQLAGDSISLKGLIGAIDGRTLRGEISGSAQDAASLGTQLAEQLLAQGGQDLLV